MDPQVVSATLRFFIRGVIHEKNGFENDPFLAVHNLDNNFCETEATWDCRDKDETGCCMQWRMLALYPKVKGDFDFEPSDKQEIALYQQEWVEFDVTDDVKNFMSHGFLNAKSWLVKKYCEKDFGHISFWSCEGGRCPELVINLRSPCR